jgi:hypothetical protein
VASVITIGLPVLGFASQTDRRRETNRDEFQRVARSLKVMARPPDPPPQVAGDGESNWQLDARGLVRADLGTVEVLAVAALTARRLGTGVAVVNCSLDLRRVIGLAGLEEVLRCGADSAVEARRQAEQREQASGVEEEDDARDAVT